MKVNLLLVSSNDENNRYSAADFAALFFLISPFEMTLNIKYNKYKLEIILPIE
ncbi:MAG: hypothetical protein L0J28_00485 [Staphylococcus simulans]|nr:hypothetical protein HMPREF3215_00588 [Staphylococcus simulans]MDN6231486.1 hypothetical protein [Staphylococcus simulans]